MLQWHDVNFAPSHTGWNFPGEVANVRPPLWPWHCSLTSKISSSVTLCLHNFFHYFTTVFVMSVFLQFDYISAIQILYLVSLMLCNSSDYTSYNWGLNANYGIHWLLLGLQGFLSLAWNIATGSCGYAVPFLNAK